MEIPSQMLWQVSYRSDAFHGLSECPGCVARDVSTEVRLNTTGIIYGTISRIGHTDNRRDERNNNENVLGVNLGFNLGEN